MRRQSSCVRVGYRGAWYEWGRMNPRYQNSYHDIVLWSQDRDRERKRERTLFQSWIRFNDSL